MKLTFACNLYDRTIALKMGDVRPHGIDLDYNVLPPEQSFLRQLRDKEFDLCEMSMSSYVRARVAGDHDFVALPVFLSRIFRHGAIYVDPRSGIRRPEDLRGRRIGVGVYQMSAAIWVRGILQDEYGIAPNDMLWVMPSEIPPPGGEDDPIEQLESMVRGIHHGGQTIEAMIENGEIDALVSAHIPKRFADGSGVLRRLFAPVQPVEEDYYRRTGIFPIMHTLVLRQAILDSHPWVASSVFAAFVAAKKCAERSLYDTNALVVMLPFLVTELERTWTLMGRDFWPYGIARNQATIETFLGYLHSQRVIARKPAISELFLALEETPGGA